MSSQAPSFASIFGRVPDIEASAPGRVNLIGEHTDYNDGFVLPIAIPQRTSIRAARRGDNQVRACSANVGGDHEATYVLGEETRTGTWVDYLAGVTVALRQAGHPLAGVDLFVESTVPLGAGLSSSASLEVAAVRALAALFDLAIDDVEAARLAHVAETQFVGVPVGVMDQMASSLAGSDAALFIDTRTLAFERVPIPPLVELLVINSGVTHEHAGGEYRVRRAECEEAAHRLGVPALRDATADGLTLVDLPPPLGRRARHVITENQRVLEMRAALLADNIPAAGALMIASHRSMRDDYEVSTPDVDALVELTQAMDGVAGARLTGGGFGGCIVALAARGRAAEIGRSVVDAYAQRTGKRGSVLVP